MFHRLSLADATLSAEWYLHTICLMLSLQTCVCVCGSCVDGSTCGIRQETSTRRYREKAAYRPVKQRKQQNQAALEDGRMTRNQRPDKLKGWRFRGTNKLVFFFFLFVFWDLWVEEHGTDENSTVAAFKHGHSHIQLYQTVFYFLTVYLHPSVLSKCYTGANSPLISPVWQFDNCISSCLCLLFGVF